MSIVKLVHQSSVHLKFKLKKLGYLNLQLDINPQNIISISSNNTIVYIGNMLQKHRNTHVISNGM